MTNEEPVPSTSSVLSSAEKNVKIVNGHKKRKGLDIDALWRKKFKAVGNGQSPEKPSEEADKPPPTTAVIPSVSLVTPLKTEEEMKKEEPEEEMKLTPVVQKIKEEEVTTRNTRSQRKKQEKPIEKNGKKKMEEVEDVKPNIKNLKKAIPISFQCSNIDDGVVRDGMIDPNKISLHNAANYGEESQDEMEVMQNSVHTEGDQREDYEFATIEYPNSVTPNGTYNVYVPEGPNYTQYYQYPNMQSSPQEGTYLVVGSQQAAPPSPMSNEDQDTGLPTNQRASPATVKWLLDNYETAEGSSLPRCQLYDHYRKHCSEHRMDAVNAASFGKLIRSVFLNLKTRRLGTRGNSKYHYYGIKIKESSLLNSMPLEQPIQSFVCTATVQQSQPQQQPRAPRRADVYADTVNQVAAVKYVEVLDQPPPKRHKQDHSSSSSSCRDSVSPGADLKINHTPIHQQPAPQVRVAQSVPPVAPQQVLANYQITDQDKAKMGKGKMPSVEFQNQEALEATIGFRKLGLNTKELNNLIEKYAYSCDEIITLVKQCKFLAVEDIWYKFWAGNGGVAHETLLALCSLDRIQEYIIEADLALYQTIVEILIPNVLLSDLSTGMTQACRTFAKNIDVYLRKALQAGKISESFIKKKIQAIKYLQRGMKRYTSLNHLAHAARGVLRKEEQVHQMYVDYLKVDITTVHQQAGWICDCDFNLVNHVSTAFLGNLQKMCTMESWAEWMESIVDQVLAKYHDKPVREVQNVGKQFLLNWSFYTSMIIRDLTLRSAMSFGSFTLIRLLADDYMYYLIESKIAKAGKQQLITVIRQDKEWPLSQSNQEYIVPANDEDLELERNGLL